MTFLGVVLVLLGLRATFDNDNQVYQTISGVLVTVIGCLLLLKEHTQLLDSIF